MKNFTNFNEWGGKFLSPTSDNPFSKALRLSLLLVFAFVGGTMHAETAYKTLTFPDDNNGNNGVSSYSTTWTATIGTDSWSIANFNNNKWAASWEYIKCGRKKVASVASISTAAAIDVSISSVVVKIDKVTATYVNSISLVVSDDAEFSNTIETVKKTSSTITTGEITFSVSTTNQAKNLYYKLVFDCAAATSNGVVQVSKVVYNTEEDVDVKSAANLVFSQTSYSLEQGVDEFTAPTFTKSTTADVTFSSDNESVATVDESGNISLAGGLGTATITASSAENSEYQAGTATCTIEVYSYNVYKKVTSITSGKKYLIVAQRTDSTMYAYPLSETYTFGYMSAGVIKELTDEISIKTTYDDSFTFTAVDGGYTIQDCYSRYLYQKGTYNSFNVGTDSYTWNVESQDDGTFKISMNDYYILWGTGSYKTFALYTEQKNAVYPMLYELVEQGSFTISLSEGYATYYNAKAYIMPEGVQGGIITKTGLTSDTKNESGTLTISYDYPAGSTVPAGTALLLNGDPDTYTFYYTTSEETAPTGNLLHGADAVDGSGYTYVDGTNVKYYLLSHNSEGTLGFYWYADNGAAISYVSPYAFLAVDFGSSSEAVKMFTLGEESTGIRSLAGDTDGAKDAAIYTLAGQRVSHMAKGGIYIVNGKKVLVR